MSIHPHEQLLLRAARAQARTPQFKQDYPTRSSVEPDARWSRHPPRAPGDRCATWASPKSLAARTGPPRSSGALLVNAGLTRHDGAWGCV